MGMDKISFNKLTNIAGANSLTGKKVGSDQDFAAILKDSIDKVNKLQLNAEAAMEKLAKGEVKDIHQVLVAVEEANLAFMTMMQIRNKLIDAYQELMRLQM